jgi:hypothetical protein
LRVTEVTRNKLQNEVVRLNSEKETLVHKIDDLDGKIMELKLKRNSRSSLKSNNYRRSDIYNQKRNLDLENDNKEIIDSPTDINSPSVSPTPIINNIHEECQTCFELRNRIREMSLDLVSRNNKITMLEVQLQSENFPYQKKCNELGENLLAVKAKVMSLLILTLIFYSLVNNFNSHTHF